MDEIKFQGMAFTMMGKDKHQKDKSCITDDSQNPIIGQQGMEELLLANLMLTGILGMAHL